MRLKKLELCGFKSFADRTTFDFDGGVTAFVGPNGCGKSNIVDAFRWILGEQSAKAVRGTQMTDVIFNGTEGRRSLGYAEASLVIENNRGVLPSEYTEVSITRRLYRSGESEYFINRQPCRLRDIRQLFMDTGVGVHTYSIIEQGKVDRFIQSNAKERRLLLEEAAGISRYKAQRNEARNRLERARQNLEKVDIKLEGQRKELRSIKRQAAKARRYRRHMERLRELVLALSAKRYREWGDERQELERKIGVLRERDDSLAAALDQLETHLRQAEAEMGRIEKANAAKREELHRIEGRIEAAEAAIGHNRQRIAEYQEETERCTQTIWSLNEKLRRTEEDINGAVRDLENIRRAIERQAQAIAEESRKADAAGAECERLAAAIEEWKNRMIQVIERATTLNNELHHMERNERDQLARRARLAGQLEEKRQDSIRIDEEIQALTGRRDEISGRLADRNSLLHEKEREFEGVAREADTLETALHGLRREETQLLSRHEILQDIELRAEDVGSGVKRLLRHEPNEDGGFRIAGMVADLVRADLEFASAIEAALGDAAQFVVTMEAEDAGAAAALLRADRAGRAGIIPLSRVCGAEGDEARLAAEAGVIGRAGNFVRYESHLEPIVRHLLGGTWIVADLSTALRLADNGGAEARFVTLEGECVEPSGVIVGGEPLPRVGIVSRKSELEAIEARLSALGDDVGRLETERGRLGQQMESLRIDVDSLRKEIERGNLEKLSNENEILNLRRRQKALGDEATLLSGEIAEIDETIGAYERRRTAIEEEMAETGREHDALQGEVTRAREALTAQQTDTARLREEVTALKVALADKEARRGGLEQSIETARAALEDIRQQVETMRRRVEDIGKKQDSAEGEISRAQGVIEDSRRERENTQKEIGEFGEALQRAQAHRGECVQKTQTARGDRDDIRKQLHGEQLQEQELRVRMEDLVERVFSEHGVRLADCAVEAPVPDAARAEAEDAVAVAGEGASGVGAGPDWAAVEEEINALRERIRRLGGVNEEAIDEEEGLEISIAEIDGQREDLSKAEAHLREVIRKLNRVCRERFTRTFEAVRANFRETFRRLFGGGRADLVLDEEELDPLEAGIEVLACPPGKELCSITLLSGGEKTMTTIALLFAIFKSKPSPFCILDEVDAALDESNIDRFTNMLVEFLKQSQFIIITHSKRTIGIADVMYGITMQEKGVSKHVAVNLERAQAMNN